MFVYCQGFKYKMLKTVLFFNPLIPRKDQYKNYSNNFNTLRIRKIINLSN